jgi:DNA-binding NtrC family response regulator
MGLASSRALATKVPAPSDDDVLRNAAVLVVDDEVGMRNFLRKSLGRRCALLETAESAEMADTLRSRYLFDLLIVDIRLPDCSGLQWLSKLRERTLGSEVIVMTAYGDLDAAVAALRVGAGDFLLKPFSLEQMLQAVRRCLGRRRALRHGSALSAEPSDVVLDGIVGESTQLKKMCDMVGRIAPTPSTVLIEGETGTGKELVARAIHTLSGRPGPFVPVNCGSIAPDLLESELFGHVRGAFTGAHSNREGLFSYAHRGTVFLDEIAEMPYSMQTKLLRVLEEKAVRPVGADRSTPIDARVITATNRCLSEEVRAGRFREDLFFRLNVLALAVPPLRERIEDITPLFQHFAEVLSHELSVQPIALHSTDMERLKSYHWPGNVRELRNVVERALLVGELPDDHPPHTVEAAAPPTPPQAGQDPGDGTLASIEKEHMLRTLELAKGNKSEAARRLGISRKTLERKLKSWTRTSASDARS